MTPAKFAPLLLARLDQVSRALASKGWPPLSTWWRGTFDAFVRSGVRQLVCRVGRRGGKSSSACQFAVAFALAYAPLGLIPPGDTGWVVFVSARRDDAAERLKTIEKALRELGLGFSRDGDVILLADTNVGFRVLTANIAAVSGYTSILAIGDEIAKWKDSDTGANPADEVLAALRPTLATQPLGRILLLSSPLTHDDAHGRAVALGDTDGQRVAIAPTWVANPTVTEEQTRRDEPNARVWRREYAAEPQASQLEAFDADAIARAFEPKLPGQTCEAVMVIDPSSGRVDTWSWAMASWVRLGETQRYLKVHFVDGVAGRFWEQIGAREIVSRVAYCARHYADGQLPARVVHADQRESLALASLFEAEGLRYVVHDWTGPAKMRAVERLRRWFRDGTIWLPQHEKLKSELLRFEERVTASGAFTFGARGGGHDDYVALLLTLAMADEERELPGSPLEIGAPVLPRDSRGRAVVGVGTTRWPVRANEQNDFHAAAAAASGTSFQLPPSRTSRAGW